MNSSIARDNVLRRSTPGVVVLVLVIGAGVVSAFQVGKATLALPSIRTDLGVDLAAASWVLSAFALVGAIASLPVGMVSDRFQARRTVIAGLMLQAMGSALGAVADGLPSLLLARALEGLGFLAVTVGAPVMVMAAARPSTRKRAFAAWATFMPVGMAVVMLAAPMLDKLGWRGLWWANAVVLAGYAGVLAMGTRSLDAHPGKGMRDGWIRVPWETLGTGGAWFLAGQFCAYTTVFFALFGFLPTILTERLAVSGAAAGILSAFAVAAGAVGCLACGALLQRGCRASHMLVAGFSALALCGVGILAIRLPGGLSYALCVLFSFAGAFIPVVIFDAAPRLAPRPGSLGSMVGLATQGNNVGIVAGPAATGAIVGVAGWQWVAVLVAAVSLSAILATGLFRHRLEAGR